MVLISLFTFVQFYSVVSRDSKVYSFADFLSFSFFYLLIIIRSGFLAEIRWSVWILKSHRSLCVSFSRTSAGLCIYHLLAWSNLNFLHIFQWITLPTQSCLSLYSFCSSLLHSLIMQLMVSSLSPQSLHLLFCCVLSILALIWLVPYQIVTPALVDGLLLEYEGQKVSFNSRILPSILADLFNAILDGFGSSSDLQLFQLSCQAFGDHSKRSNYNWYHYYFHVPLISSFYGKV